jgi:CrcB protein
LREASVNNIQLLLTVFIGGGIGSILRFLAVASLSGIQFYLGTFLVNLLGSFLIGFIYKSESVFLTPSLKIFLMTGVLGGLTTFSGFALDFLQLAQMGEVKKALLYFIITNLLAISGCFLGYQVALRQ